MVTVATLYKEALEKAPSSFEAGELFRLAAGKPAHELNPSGPVPPEQAKALRQLLTRRASGVPLQYLLGEWEFYSIPLKVGPGVLIPRQDTETLVDVALGLLRQEEADRPGLLDLCSGTGCVALAIGRSFPGADITALEFSLEAYGYLAENIARGGQAIRPVLCDLREYTHPVPLDMIVSNPPYIPRRELAALQTEVGHEPLIALDGGEDGLFYFRAIARRYREQLRPGGALLLEIGMGQEQDVADILSGFGYERLREYRDTGGIIRVMEARAPEG